MTNEEKAEEYVLREDVETIKYSECYGERVFFEKEVKKAYIDGLAEGEKIGKEKQWKATEKAQKKTSSKIKELEIENAELKEKLEKEQNLNKVIKERLVEVNCDCNAEKNVI